MAKGMEIKLAPNIGETCLKINDGEEMPKIGDVIESTAGITGKKKRVQIIDIGTITPMFGYKIVKIWFNRKIKKERKHKA